MILGWLYAIAFVSLYSVSSGSPPEAMVTIHGKGTRGPYNLGYRNLLSGTFSVHRDTLELPADKYSVQYIAGLVSFSEPLPVGDSLTTRFRFLPLSLNPQYALHRLASGDLRVSGGTPAPTLKGGGPGDSDLSVTGSKGFSIETGQGAGGLSQSLNLTINGDIVSGLRTSAHISDKSSGGSVSRRVEEIDKLYIEAESEHFKGTFGDFDYIEQGGEFMNFRRKLAGLNAGYKKDEYSIGGAAAFFPGEYSSMTITGVDGRLGPYYLRDISGREGAAILAGSERVYIDGALQKRGSDNDYIIDYEAGAIEFAPAKVITAQSRITVDYEIARQEYGRSFYAAGGHNEIIPGLNVSGVLIQEGDRSGSPKSFEMTSQNRARLEEAGGDRLRASLDGATFVGAGNGDYVLLVDTLGNNYYSFAGGSLGNYNVTFSFIGNKEGSYSARGGGVFEYIGIGLGDYEPIILIPLPQQKRYGSAGASFAAADSIVFIKTELAGSLYDQNTLSEKDESLRGLSGLVTAGMSRQAFGEEGLIRITGRARSISSSAVFPGRIDEVERHRIYDLDPESGPEGERSQEIGIDGRVDQFRKIVFETGILSRPGIQNRLRYTSRIDWRLPGSLDWFAFIEKTDGERTWWKRSSGIEADYRIVQPSFRVNYESRDGDSGFKFYEYQTSLPAKYADGLSGNTEIAFRDEKYFEAAWHDKFISGSVQQKIEIASGRSGLSGELAGSYFKKQYRDYIGADTDQKSGTARLTFTDPGGRGEFFLSERLTSSNERLRAKTYIYAGQGNGEYRYEDGEYINDPDGNYTLLIEELGEGLRITEISTGISGSMTPLNIVDPQHGLETRIGRAVVETELACLLKKSSDVIIGRDFYPWRKDGANNVLFNSGRIDLRFYLYPSGTKHRWKYSLTRSFQDGNPYANETVRERYRSDEISWAFPAGSRIDLLAAGLLSRKQNEFNGAGYAIESHRESLKTDFKLTEIWVLETGLGFEAANQSDVDAAAKIPSARIALIRDFGNRGRMSADISYYRVIVDPEGAYIPYQVAQGKREGDNITAGAIARMELYKNGRLDFLYRFEKFAKRPERHNMKIEFTVLFQ